MLTPWAELLVRPVDGDDVVRRAWHAIARVEHADATADRRPGPRWQAAKAAYEAVEDEAARMRWAAALAHQAGLCAVCVGFGVTWRRVGKDRGAKVCAACGGEGKVTR
jgi:hypothetical protein